MCCVSVALHSGEDRSIEQTWLAGEDSAVFAVAGLPSLVKTVHATVSTSAVGVATLPSLVKTVHALSTSAVGSCYPTLW